MRGAGQRIRPRRRAAALAKPSMRPSTSAGSCTGGRVTDPGGGWPIGGSARPRWARRPSSSRSRCESCRNPRSALDLAASVVQGAGVQQVQLLAERMLSRERSRLLDHRARLWPSNSSGPEPVLDGARVGAPRAAPRGPSEVVLSETGHRVAAPQLVGGGERLDRCRGVARPPAADGPRVACALEAARVDVFVGHLQRSAEGAGDHELGDVVLVVAEEVAQHVVVVLAHRRVGPPHHGRRP